MRHAFRKNLQMTRKTPAGVFLMPLNRFFGYMLVGLKRQDVVAKCTWMATIVNLAGNFILVPVIGISAVAYTTIITEFLVTVVEFVILQKQTHYFFG